MAAAPAAQPATATAALIAQFRAALIKERRLADDREGRAIAAAETRLGAARAQFDSSLGRSTAEARFARTTVVVARRSFAATADSAVRREVVAREEVARYREEVEGVVNRATPEKRAALERFGAGDRAGAWPVLAELTQASEQARTAAANVASAAEVWELAELYGVMRRNGEASVRDVLARWDEAAALDPRHCWTQVERARLAVEAGNLTRADSSAQRALAVSLTERQRSAALNEPGDIRITQGDLASARAHYEESLAIDRRLAAAADPANGEAHSGLSMSLTRLGDTRTAQGDLAVARAQYEESLAIDRRLAVADPSSAQAQRDLFVSLWTLAGLPDSGVRWTDVVTQLESMQARGQLAPADTRFLDEARRNAANQPPAPSR